MAIKLNFNQLPDPETINQNFEPGEYKLTIYDAKVVQYQSGSYGLQLTHKINDTNFELRFDNYPVETSYGQSKLKKLLKAINVIPEGDFDISILPPLIKGKSFIAYLDYGKTPSGERSEYLSITNINRIRPIETEEEEISFETEEEEVPFIYDEVGF